MRNSWCSGEEGKEAFAMAEGRRRGQDLITDGTTGDGGDAEPGKDADADGAAAGDANVKAAAAKETKKRTLEELQSGISAEDMEKYKRSKLSGGDPMAAMLGRDELLEKAP